MIFFDSPEKEIISLVEHGPIPKKKLISTASKSTSKTPQQIYRVLNKLIEHGVLVENNKNLAFSGSYLIKLREYYLRVSKQYTDQSALENFIPELNQKGKASMTFRNYHEMSKLWDHLGVLLKTKSSEVKPYYFVESYSYWFRYFKNEAVGYINFMKSHNYHPVWVCKSPENDTILNDVKGLRSHGVEVIFNDSLDINTGFNFFDEYVIEIHYNPTWFSHIHEVYRKNISQDSVMVYFNESANFKFTIYKNTKKFDMLKKKLEREII